MEISKEGLGFFRVKVLWNWWAEEEIAFCCGGACNLHEVKIVGGVATHHRDVPLHFVLLAQEHANFRIIAREEDDVWGCGLELGQNCVVVAFARSQRVIENNFYVRGVEQSFGFVGKAFSIRRIIM